MQYEALLACPAIALATADEVVSFRYRSISLVKRSACAAREVAPFLLRQGCGGQAGSKEVFRIKSAPAVLKNNEAARLHFFVHRSFMRRWNAAPGALHSKGAAFSSLPRRNEMKPGHLH